MKSSKSQKNITIITDRKSQYDLLAVQSPSNSNRYARTSKNKAHQNYSSPNQMAINCKILTEQGDQNQHRSRSASIQKHKRQRSSSLQNRQQSALSQQNRKKQLDYLCFQRIINQIKRYLIQKEEVWHFSCLCYGQLLRLLWLCRFIPYANQIQFIQNHQQGELKKVYLLWLSISLKKYVSFRDFLNIVQMIQHIFVDQQRMEQSISSFELQIKQLCSKPFENFYEDPHYTFFIKRIQIHRSNSGLIINQATKEKIFAEFKSFKFNKLKDSGIFQCVKIQQEPMLISKKSCELASQKRKKIEQKIRQKKPHIQNINLLDLLSYRQRDHTQTNKKNIIVKKKKSQKIKKGELKKQIQLLSRPKTYFEERKEDEINYSKQQQQFTFHPKINNCKINGKDKVLQIKNVDKVLVRMKQARKLKQEKQTIIQKGWSNHNKPQNIKCFTKKTNSNICQISSQVNKQNINTQKQQNKLIPIQNQNQEKQKQKQKQTEKVCKYQVSKDYLRIPILYIDVNIEQGKKQRIIIYDNDKADELAKQFGKKHKLTQQTIGRLQMLLQQQMDTVLARIDEQTDDDCSIIY